MIVHHTVHTHKDQDKNYVIQASELHGWLFPDSPLPHPDNDKWKHTLFTNTFCISAVCYIKITHVKWLKNVLIHALFDM